MPLKKAAAEASSQTALAAALNGGAGVTRGQFRITDGSGDQRGCEYLQRHQPR